MKGIMAELKNTKTSYGYGAKFFHWLIALLVIGLLAAGLYMDAMDASPLKFKIYNWHKSLGFMVLWLVALRLIWKFFNSQPDLISPHRWERLTARGVHFLLYICLFLQPLSGWLMSSADSQRIFGRWAACIENAHATARKVRSRIGPSYEWLRICHPKSLPPPVVAI